MRVILMGASALLGRKLALRLSLHSSELVIAARQEDRLQCVAAEIGDSTTVDVVAFDLANSRATQHAAESILARHPKIDVLINVAGGSYVGPLNECASSTLRHEVDAYVRGLSLFTALMLPALRQAKTSLIVNLLADWVTRTGAMEGGNALFTMTKTALAAFGEGIASEEWRNGVAVSNVYLGEMSPLDDTSRISRTPHGLPELLSMDEVCDFVERLIFMDTARISSITLVPADRSYARRRAQAGGSAWDIDLGDG